MARTVTPRKPRRPARSSSGGHTALTPAVQKRIVANIAKGVHVEVAARAAGISKQTFYAWLERGTDKVSPETGEKIVAPQPYRDFRDAIEEADAALELSLVNRYRDVSEQAAFGNAAHLAGFLGRRYRARWALKAEVEVSGPEGGPVKVEGTDDRLAGVLAALARAGKVALTEAEAGDGGGADPAPE